MAKHHKSTIPSLKAKCVSEFRISPVTNFNFHSVHTTHYITPLPTAFAATPVIKTPAFHSERNILRGSSIHMNSLQIFPPNVFAENVGEVIVFRAIRALGGKNLYCSASQSQLLLCLHPSAQILSAAFASTCAQSCPNPAMGTAQAQGVRPDAGACGSGEGSVSAYTPNHVCIQPSYHS